MLKGNKGGGGNEEMEESGSNRAAERLKMREREACARDSFILTLCS